MQAQPLRVARTYRYISQENNRRTAQLPCRRHGPSITDRRSPEMAW